ncbi:MAG: hypothetical protein IME97_02815 [Proteobacteria bacterium]|nr:hypothetical protein [Pseudomonadota bacterium]
MRLTKTLVLPLALAGFLVAGSGCGEQEEKAKDRGTGINATIDNLQNKAQETTTLATKKLNEMAKDLEEATEEK